jgi:glutathione S-transferase
MSSSRPRLVVLQPSHYCEKAKWALQRYSIAFDVDAHAPGFHMAAAKGKGSTPCLIFPDGSFKDDSSLILRWIDEQQGSRSGKAKLFPADCESAVTSECARFDAGLGVDSRLFIYAHCLDSSAVYTCLMAGVPSWQRIVMSLGFWYAVKGKMRKGMRISPSNGSQALERLREEFQRVGKLLEDGRKFLCGGVFTAADLTFVALAAPVLGIQYGTYPVFANPDDMPKAVKDVTEEMRSTPAGIFALQIWETQRAVVL